MATFVVSNTNDGGDGSLRRAITDANANPGADEIVFADSARGTLVLTQGDLRITDAVEIAGPGSDLFIVDGREAGLGIRVDDGDVNNFLDVSIAQLAFTTMEDRSGYGTYAAGFYGELRNAEDLTLSNVEFSNFKNFSISNKFGSLDILSSEIVNNGYSNGYATDDAMIHNYGTLTIKDSLIDGNQSAGYLVLSHSSDDYDATGAASLHVQNSLVCDNSGQQIISATDLVVSNSTVFNNFSTFGAVTGAGVVANSTIVGNQAAGYETSSEFVPGFSGIDGSISLYSSIVAHNGDQTHGRSVDDGSNVGAGVTSGGNNLISMVGEDNGAFVDGENGDIVGNGVAPIDPQLGPLQDNGGDTPTLALQAGSRAIDAGANAHGLSTDQRGEGMARVVNGQADIGAFEHQNPAPGPVFGVWGEASAGGGFVGVGLGHSFDDPVVFIQPLSLDDPTPATWRLKKVAADRFTVYAERPDHLAGDQSTSSFRYLVLESGSWRLPDGSRVEVGTLDSAHLAPDGFELVDFDQPFDQAPAVLSQVQSRNSGAFVVTRQQGLSEAGFEVVMQEEEARADSGHALETIGWAAFEPGVASGSGWQVEAGTTARAFNDVPSELTFEALFDAAPALFASMATTKGIDTAWLRSEDIGASAATLMVQEDQSADSEQGHTKEAVSYVALGDTEGVLVGQRVEVIGAVRHLTELTHQQKTVDFGGQLDDPVVFAGPLTLNGGAPVTTRLSSITATSVTLAVDEPNYLDGSHKAEAVTVLALEAGVFEIGDGHRLEVGTITTNLLSTKGFADVSFSDAFDEVPAVMAQVQTANGADWVLARVDDVTTDGFRVAMQEEALLNREGKHANEVIGWLAIEPDLMTWSGQEVEAFRAPRLVNHVGGDLDLADALGAEPLLVAGIASFHGSDPTNLRLAGIDDGEASFVAHEEQSHDEETAHWAREDVAGLAFAEEGLLTGLDVLVG